MIDSFSKELIAEASSTSITRIMGDNRFETAAEISSSTYDQADVVVLANARDFADALAGVPLAHALDAPILIAQGNRLHPAVREEIDRLNAREVVILGGEQAVSVFVQEELETLDLQTRRISGTNRFETAERIAEELNALKNTAAAVLVDGFEFADAMSVAPFAAREGMPIYLTRSNNLMNEETLNNYQTVYIIGGPNAVSSGIEQQLGYKAQRLDGADRYATNWAVLNYFTDNSDRLLLATGTDFADALTGSLLAAKENTGIALVRGSLSNTVKRFSRDNSVSNYTILGGERAVANSIYEDLKAFNAGKSVQFNHPNEGKKDYKRFEELVLKEVNKLRQENNVKPLTLNENLSKAATIRAYETGQRFSHTRPDGSSFMHVFADYNIQYNYRRIGENLAFGPEHKYLEDTAYGTFMMWSMSQGHRDNMLNPNFEEIGIGYYDINRRVYASQIFGTR